MLEYLKDMAVSALIGVVLIAALYIANHGTIAELLDAAALVFGYASG